MKKSLLALAVLSAFAGAASAQSSVTLSGSVDLGLVRSGGDWAMATAGSGRSALNFSGNEDLGGGMRAFFNVNTRFKPNDGAVNETITTRFYRQLWVGLGGGFGEVRLGRFLPPLQTMNGNYDPFGTDTVGSTHTGGIGSGSGGSARNNNQIEYISPSLGGLQLRGSIAAADQNGGAERPIGVSVGYGGGPVSVGAAYDRNGLDLKTVGIYGSFNAGFATFMAQFEKGDLSASTDTKHYSVGAKVPLGNATLKAGFRKFSTEETKKLGIGLDYNLSKRTQLYTDIGKLSGDGASDAQKKTAFDVGIFHKF